MNIVVILWICSAVHKWRNCRLTTKNPDYQHVWTILAECLLLYIHNPPTPLRLHFLLYKSLQKVDWDKSRDPGANWNKLELIQTTFSKCSICMPIRSFENRNADLIWISDCDFWFTTSSARIISIYSKNWCKANIKFPHQGTNQSRRIEN